jgi:hypothetical protein
VSNGWRKAYKELKDFITENSGIEIDKGAISIPGNTRPEFYRLFEAVRATFLEEKFPHLLERARLLNANYVEVEHEITELLRLEGVSLSAGLDVFLHHPKEGLIAELFDPLFDLLRGTLDTELFEQKAAECIEAAFRGRYSSAYGKWVVLSLLRLIESDKNFHVSLSIPPPRQRIRHPPGAEALVPPLEESGVLSFQHQPSPTLTVPDFIVHSTKMNMYLGVISGLVAPMAVALDASDKREWYPVEFIPRLEPDTMLVYVDDKPEHIALVADRDRICRPDLIMKCLSPEDSLKNEELEIVKLQHSILQPRMGTYLFSSVTKSEQKLIEADEDIHFLTVGFDKSRLSPIINALSGEIRRSFVT